MTPKSSFVALLCALATLLSSRPLAAATIPPAISFTASTASVGEGDGNLIVHFVRTGDLSGQSKASAWFQGPATAIYGIDYVSQPTNFTFAPFEATKDIAISIINDAVYEGDETFTMELFNTENATIGSPRVLTVTIVDDDPAALISFASTTTVVSEHDGMATVRVLRDGVTNVTTTVRYATTPYTATANADYTPVSGVLAFAPGERLKTFDVPIIDDTVPEGVEFLIVTLSDVTNGGILYGGSATVAIVDDDPSATVGFSSPAYSIDETGDTVTITVIRSGNTTIPVTLAYRTRGCMSSCQGLATPGLDYIDASGTLQFAAGETAKTFNVAILDDLIVEGNETFDVDLTILSVATSFSAPSTARITILDDESPASYGFSQPAYEVSEGAGALTVTVLRTGSVIKPSAVAYATAGACCSPGQATPNADYTHVIGMLTFAAGESSKTISIPILQDTLLEGPETFRIVLTPAIGPEQAATITILDDEAPPAVTIANVSVPEGDAGLTQALVTLRLTAPFPGAFSVSYNTADGSAKAGSDYLAASGTITFNAGETVKTIPISVVGDTVDEPDETFQLLFLPSGSGCCGMPHVQPSAVITIRNDDATGALSVDDIALNEGDGGETRATFTVKLSAPLRSPVSVGYSTAAGTAQDGSDFIGVNGTLLYAAGETTKQVSVPIIGDRIPEENETFFLRLANATGAAIMRGQAKATIVNDDLFYIEYDDLVYAGGGKHALSLDLFLPTGESGRRPLVIWVHGDHWMDGSRAASPAIREANRGYAVASIDYRSSDAATFPAQIDDLKAAVRWLRSNAARYNIDPDRVAVWGFGSGGHLAALLGTSGGVTALEDLSEGNPSISSRAQLVIDWAGPIDLLQLQKDAPDCGTLNHDSSGSYESLLLGCFLQRCPDRADAANPASYVSTDDPPFLLMHGRDDCEVGVAQSENFARALRAAHLDVSLKVYDGVGHNSSFWDSQQALAEVDAFLDTHLKAPQRVRASRH